MRFSLCTTFWNEFTTTDQDTVGGARRGRGCTRRRINVFLQFFNSNSIQIINRAAESSDLTFGIM